MANVFRLNVRKEDVVIRWLGSLPLLADKRMGEGLERGGKILVDTAKQVTQEKNAVGATKEVLNGWRFSAETSRTDRRVGFLYNEAPHFFFVNQGRKPGKMPPKGATSLLQWMAFKGIPPQREFLVRRAIGRKGIKGRDLLQKTYDRAARDVFEEFDYALNRVMRDMQ